MSLNFQNILYIFAAGVLLLGGVFILRFVLKFAWKIVRAALIVASLFLLVGYFLGFLDIVLH